MPGGKRRLAYTQSRLMAAVAKLPNGCWEWQRFVNPHGYGTTSYYGRRGTPAHRAMYMEFVGPIPEDLTLDHLCHTQDATCRGGTTCVHRRCVNPEHMDPVPSDVNVSRGVIARRTHCPVGHPYGGDNLILTSNGGRACRECARQRGRDRLVSKRADRPANWTPKSRKRPTHCKRGHAFDEENTYPRSDGRSGCKTCRKANSQAWRARKAGLVA